MRQARRRSRGRRTRRLPRACKSRGHRAVYTIDKPEQLAPLVRGMAQPGDIVMCLGAGTITQWAYALPGQLEAFDKAAP